MIDGLAFLELMQMPFMQRAIVGGSLLGATGGLLGSFTVMRQLSFFGDALGHSAMLGISLGVWWGINPNLMLLPFLVLLGLAVTELLDRSQLWTDAVLNVVYSSSLALAIIILSFIDQYKGGLSQFLFGDILTVSQQQIQLNLGLFLVCFLFLILTIRSQMLLILSEPLAQVRGVPVQLYRTIFIVLLSLVVAMSIQSVGVLLVSSFIVIPPCTARLWSDDFATYIPLAVVLGTISAGLGVALSALIDLPSGPVTVLVQFSVFVLSLALSKRNHFIS